MTGNDEVTRDLAQDVWIRVHGRLEQFEARADVFTWIYRIAVNRTLNHLVSEKRRRWVRILDLTVGEAMRSDEPAPVVLSATDQPPDRSVEDEQLSQHLWLAIQRLDPMYRVPLVLFHFEDQSYTQVGETMGISMRAAQARIIRARKQLKKIMGPIVKQL
jgi:RNA polymerase sigma-70 factor (ECF subfamily)